MTLVGVLTNCCSGDLLALASLFEFYNENDQIHVRIYGQKPELKARLILLLHDIVLGKRLERNKNIVQVQFSKHSTLYEKVFYNKCLSDLDYDIPIRFHHDIPTHFDILYAFCEIEELMDIDAHKNQKMHGDTLVFNGSFNVLKVNYLMTPNVSNAHHFFETHIKYLRANFKKIFYITDKSVIGKYNQDTKLNQLDQKDNGAILAWLERLCQGDNLFEYHMMNTKNDNLSLKYPNKYISTSIDVISFAMVLLPTFSTLFEKGNFVGLDKDTLQPIFDQQGGEDETWYYLNVNKHQDEIQRVLHGCLVGYFKGHQIGQKT